MPKKIYLYLAFSAFLVTMCKAYDQGGPLVSPNGLSCQNYSGAFSSGGAECFYSCPDKTIRQPVLPENFSTESSLYLASKGELDAQFCGMASAPTATIPPAITNTPLATLVSIPSPTLTLAAEASPTVEAAATIASSPLLTSIVTMCDQTVDLISFRIAETAPDLTDKTLAIQISDQETTCSINPVNTSLLTCELPGSITFPARVLVTLDGAVVNDFNYDGVGCIIVDTAIPNNTQTP
jgi:hypothetical protein